MRPAMQRRHAMGALVCCSAGLMGLHGRAHATSPTAISTGTWPAWNTFARQFVSADGRVVDSNSERSHTVSEAQAYALFFALVSNDRYGFERLLRWTEDNLCQGDLSAHLPAWQWGRQDHGAWGVLDRNPASDADLWLAYALGEAGRLWNERRYSALSRLVSARVLREETAELPGLGLTLLPGPQGFALGQGRWRLNASYCPPQLMQWLTRHAEPAAAWKALAASAQKLTLASAPKGFAADWTVYAAGSGFVADGEDADTSQGSYNAIRVYLWAGTLHADAPGRTELLKALQPMARHVRETGEPPESIDILSGQAKRAGPPGFSAALLPFLQAQQDTAALQSQRARLKGLPPQPDAYYEQALTLFALGWMDGYYRYAADGSLLPRWSQP
ncbi:cellulase [Rhodoferax lacus]|uniref:cellulase n=2 Tax=Rhodoferax lacus TaxID=2184758 RepID=A0A3E1RFV9_9BURK|nr:cellulase [Rhodoferax lacus]